MAIKPFHLGVGAKDDNLVYYLSGTGAPGGRGGAEDLAGVGSYYTDTATGDTYKKIAAGAGAANWIRVATVQDLSSLSAQQSWREPVAVLDNTHTSVTAALTAMNASNTLDGHNIQAGDRILFTAFQAPDNPNVYIVGGSAGAWTLTEDTNPATAGDTLRVLYGTFANQEWFYDGTQWLWIGQQTSAEEAAIRAFIGKASTGNIMPSYTSTTYVANGDALDVAIGKLDSAAANLATQIGNNTTSINSIQTTIGAITTGAGLSATGQYTANPNAHYINTATSLANADNLLDAALFATDGKVANIVSSAGFAADGTFAGFTGANYVGTATTLVQGIQQLDTALAATDANVSTLQGQVGTVSFTGTTFVSTATDLTTAIQQLDAALADAVAPSSTTTAGTNITLDSVPTRQLSVLKWVVVVEDSANNANREAFEVLAIHDGTSLADATTIDHTRYAKVEAGNGIPNLTVDVVLVGTGNAQRAQLVITAGTPVVARAKRLAV